MTNTTWLDEDELAQRAMRAARTAARVPLLAAAPPPSCGTYLLWLVADPTVRPSLARYGDLTLGRHPIYIGSAVSLAERAARHVATLRNARGIGPADIWLSWLPPTASIAGALLAESLLQQQLRPLFCEPEVRGFGSRMQGAVRQAGQAPSPFDSLHRRGWARKSTPEERLSVVLFVAARAVHPTRESYLWGPLVPLSHVDPTGAAPGDPANERS